MVFGRANSPVITLRLQKRPALGIASRRSGPRSRLNVPPARDDPKPDHRLLSTSRWLRSRVSGCESAWGPGADRRYKRLINWDFVGSMAKREGFPTGQSRNVENPAKYGVPRDRSIARVPPVCTTVSPPKKLPLALPEEVLQRSYGRRDSRNCEARPDLNTHVSLRRPKLETGMDMTPNTGIQSVAEAPNDFIFPPSMTIGSSHERVA